MKDPVKEFDQKHVYADVRMGEDQLVHDHKTAQVIEEKAQNHSVMNLLIDKAPIEQIVSLDSMNQPKAVMSIENCPHKDRKHYAKGMCKYCYSLNGREAFAHKCIHRDKKTYARGLCRNCYTNLKR